MPLCHGLRPPSPFSLFFRPVNGAYIIWLLDFEFELGYQKAIVSLLVAWIHYLWVPSVAKFLLPVHIFVQRWWLQVNCLCWVILLDLSVLFNNLLNKLQKRVKMLFWKCKMKCNLLWSPWKQKQPKLKGVLCRSPKELQKLQQKVWI